MQTQSPLLMIANIKKMGIKKRVEEVSSSHFEGV